MVHSGIFVFTDPCRSPNTRSSGSAPGSGRGTKQRSEADARADEQRPIARYLRSRRTFRVEAGEVGEHERILGLRIEAQRSVIADAGGDRRRNVVAQSDVT